MSGVFVSSGWVCTGVCVCVLPDPEAYHTLPPSVDRKMPVEILPYPKLRLRAVEIGLYIHFFFQQMYNLSPGSYCISGPVIGNFTGQ